MAHHSHNKFILPLRIAQAILAIIILGLTAYVINVYNGPYAGYSPDSVNFLLFCSIWTLLAVTYLVLAPVRFEKAAHKFAILGVEALTMLFWFAGFIAVSVLWTDLHCGSQGGACGAGTAADVFAAIEWVLFVGSTAIAGRHVYRTRNEKNNDGAPPDMEVAEAAP